jgi:TonB family protein
MANLKTTLLAVLLAAALDARAQDAVASAGGGGEASPGASGGLGGDAGPPAGAGTLTRAPAVVEPATPEYPDAAKAQGISGEVALELDVSAEGRVMDARVLSPAGHGFEEAALAAARRLVFSPAEIDGKPAAVTLEYRFRFDAPPPPPPPVQVAVLRGVVVERGTREPLAGVAVSAGDATGHTDAEGRFELAGLPPGAVKVVAHDPAHHRFETEEVLEAGKALEVRYYLRRAAKDLYEAVIVGQREKKEVTTVTITTGEVTRIAGVSGDTVRVIQNLPGVARSPAGFGDLVVRGGNPNDTRVYVDGVEVPQVFHFGGLTSVVPSELVGSVDFEAGNYGVRYGRATGGRVDLAIRDPDAKRLHLVTDANLYHALAMVEGPAAEDVSVALAVRRSYADAVIRKAAESSDEFGISVAPRYYDFQGKLVWRAGPDDVVRLALVGADDRMVFTDVDLGLEEADELRWGTAFVQAVASWDHRFSATARARVQLAQGVVDEANRFGDLASMRNRFHLTSLRAEGSRDVASALTLAAGVDGIGLGKGSVDLEIPNIPGEGQLSDPNAPKARLDEILRGFQTAAWVEASWRPLAGLVVVPGVRVDHSDFLASMTWFDPRLSARYALREGTTLKGGVGLYHQPPLIPYVTREWGNPDLHEEGAWHTMLGVEHRIAGPLTADVQLYYKRLFDLALPSGRLVSRGGALVPERFANGGSAKAYGAELLLRWNPGGRFFGWLAYSLSRSIHDQDVIGGTLVTTGDAYDQPHNLVALGTWDLPEVWDGFAAGFRLRYTTGNPYRRVAGAVFDSDGGEYQPVLEESYGGRMPDFFQLDIRLDKRWTWRTWILSAYLEAQNVTNRKNAEDVAYNHDYTEQGWLTGLPFFPSFGIRAEY